jgi:NADPH:quinone reductase-like Zn-dependent oxidoreductase
MVQLLQASLQGRRNSQPGSLKAHVLSLVQSQKDLVFMKELLESGKVVPVIDGSYPLAKTPQALWYFEKVHPRGKVVITMEETHKTQGEE